MTLTPLRRSSITSDSAFPAVTVGSRTPGPERVLQFGEGNFLRAFVDWQFQELIDAGKFSGSIVVVQPLPKGMVNMLNAQEGLYTVVQRGIVDGAVVERPHLVTAITRGIDPYTDYAGYLQCAANPAMRFIISNTTESGIEYVKSDRPTITCPATYPAKVAAFLFERFTVFTGDVSKGMVIIPCELIEANGDNLKKCVLQHAVDWGYGQEFIDWLAAGTTFCNTLVDRIVPGYPKEEAAELCSRFGYQDDLIVACEVFHKWVIQGGPAVQKELPFETIGLNVVWTDDITPHRTLKVRILNGAHTTFTIPAFLAGQEFVRESMEDGQIGKFIRSAVFDEILPTLKFDQKEKDRFAEAVLERFRNPFIKHALLSITLNSVSKYKVRVLPSLLEYQRTHQQLPHHLCFGLAALIRFYHPSSRTEKGATGSYQGRSYPIQDADDVIAFFANAWSSADAATVARTVLSNSALWGSDLTLVPNLSETISAMLTSIEQDGIRAAMESRSTAGWNAKILMHKNF